MRIYHQRSMCRCDFEVTINCDGLLICNIYPRSRSTLMTNYEDEESADIMHLESVVKQFNEKFSMNIDVCEMSHHEWRLQGTDTEILTFIKWVK